MIADLRIYTCKPNKMAAFVKIYQDLAWPLQQKYLGNCLGWYTTVEGPLNRVVHMWGYADQADRERRRNALAAERDKLHTLNTKLATDLAGQTSRAIGLSTVMSVIGGLAGVLVLAAAAPLIGDMALKFAPRDYFRVAANGLRVVGSLAEGSLAKGIFAAGLGAGVGLPGHQQQGQQCHPHQRAPPGIGGENHIPEALPAGRVAQGGGSCQRWGHAQGAADRAF